jgi:hypothetical protein
MICSLLPLELLRSRTVANQISTSMRLCYGLGVFCALLWSSFAAVRNETGLSEAIAASTTSGKVIEFQANIVLTATVRITLFIQFSFYSQGSGAFL